MGMRVVFYLFFLFLFCCHSLTCFALLTSKADTSHQNTTIPPVIVVARRTENRSLSNAPKTVLTEQEMAASGVTSLVQALQEMGEVQLQDTTGNASQVLLSMRGFGANAISNTLLLLNGIPLTNPDLAPPDLNTIPLQDIEYIEVISGSESVLYGDQAVGGLINIITKKNQKHKIELSCTNGSYDQRSCYATFNHHYNQLYYGLSVLKNHNNNYRDHNDYDQNFLTGRLYYPYTTGNIGFDFRVGNERMLYPGALTAAQVAQNRRQANNDTDFFKNGNGFYHFEQQQQLGANCRLEMDLTRREMHGNGVLSNPFTQSRIIYFIKPQLIGKINKVLSTTGIDYEDDRYYLNSEFFTTHDNQQKYGIFSALDIPITSDLSLLIGARGAQQNIHLSGVNNVNRALATTIGTTFQLNHHAKIYLRRAESFRFPKADENTSTLLAANGLKTQKGVSYETGVQWDGERWSSKFGLYQLNLEDEIAFDPTQTSQAPFGTNRNLDLTVRRGFSLSEKYQLTHKLILGGQYNYVNASFQSGTNKGNRIPLVSENLLRANVNYEFINYWNIYLEALHTGNQFAANDDANIAGKIGGYTIYNVNLHYHYKQLSASFRINNLFNKYYYFYTGFNTFSVSDFFYPAPGRNLLFTMTYAFV